MQKILNMLRYVWLNRPRLCYCIIIVTIIVFYRFWSCELKWHFICGICICWLYPAQHNYTHLCMTPHTLVKSCAAGYGNMYWCMHGRPSNSMALVKLTHDASQSHCTPGGVLTSIQKTGESTRFQDKISRMLGSGTHTNIIISKINH